MNLIELVLFKSIITNFCSCDSIIKQTAVVAISFLKYIFSKRLEIKYSLAVTLCNLWVKKLFGTGHLNVRLVLCFFALKTKVLSILDVRTIHGCFEVLKIECWIIYVIRIFAFVNWGHLFFVLQIPCENFTRQNMVDFFSLFVKGAIYMLVFGDWHFRVRYNINTLALI